MVKPSNFTINSNYPAQGKNDTKSTTITFPSQSIAGGAEKIVTKNVTVQSSQLFNPAISVIYNDAGLTGEIFLGYGWVYQDYTFRNEVFIQRTSATNIRIDIYVQNIDDQGRTIVHQGLTATVYLNAFKMP